MDSTRGRLIRESMSLFGAKGYSGTSVAEIEAAAGFSPGAGNLYRHFSSKADLLAAGVREQVVAGERLLALLEHVAQSPALSMRERLTAVAFAGLRRLEEEGDLNRVLIKDLAHFPDLLAIVRQQEIARVHDAVSGWLSAQSGSQPTWADDYDYDAVAAILVGSISNYWMLCDIFGQHPTGINEDRYIATLVDLLLPALPPDDGGAES